MVYDTAAMIKHIQPLMSGLEREWRIHLEDMDVKVSSRTTLLLPKDGSFVYAQAQPNMLAAEVMDSKGVDMVALGGGGSLNLNSAVKTTPQATSEQTASTSLRSRIRHPLSLA